MIITPNRDNTITLMNLLQERFQKIDFIIKGRELKHNKEGCKNHQHWVQPETRVAIEKEELEIAIDDFKNILAQLRKLK